MEGVPVPNTMGTRKTTASNPARRMADSARALERRYSLGEASSAPGALKYTNRRTPAALAAETTLRVVPALAS